MPNEPEGWHTDSDQDEEGGPVKSFLEHLEDLRWVLIKSLVALGITFLVCLIAGDRVVSVLMFPLKQAKVQYPPKVQIMTAMFGTNRLGVFQMPVKQGESFGLGTNHFVTIHLEPVMVGTNHLLGFNIDTNSTGAEGLSISITSFGPAAAFVVAVQAAAYGGALLASPFIIFFIAQFVFPALRMKEKRYVFRGMFFGIGLFFVGVVFCYFFLMPVALAASVKYTNWLGFAVNQWRAEDYISFVSKFMLGMGLGFELPVILLVLVKIGILDYKALAKSRRYVIVISFILGAVLTTPEVITQVLMALPLMGLYEITVWIAWYWEEPDRSKANRKLAVGLLVVALVAALLWVAWRYGWPWLVQQWH
jgi:sec-independent protein translocase protein TatC